MKKFLLAIAAVALIATTSKSFAAWGLWDGDRSWIGLNQNGTTNYWSVWSAGTGTFNGAALGTYSNTSTLNINAYDVKTFKNGGDNVTGGTFYWTVYSGSRPATPTFSSIALNWISDLDANGNQKWGFTGGTTSILADPAVSFTGSNNYTFEFYVQVNGTGGSVYDNNNGNASNYSATFSTVPEPSTWALLSLSAIGMGGYVVRRRRR